MAKKIAQMIEEQIQFSTLKSTPGKFSSQSSKKQPIITISREFGARGAALSSHIGHKLGFKVWDKELLEVISENLGSNKEFIASLDENRRSALEDTIFGFMNHKGTNLNYLIYLVRAIRAIEKFGNGIIVGRGANFICRDPNSFHLRIVCPIKNRVEDYAEREQITKDEALSIIGKKDAERASFVNYNFNKDIALPTHYDLVINSASFSLEEISEFVFNIYRERVKP